MTQADSRKTMTDEVSELSPLGKSWGLTRNIPFPNIYVKMLPEYKGWIFLEEEALKMKGRWSEAFGDPRKPLDLEIGCGNGFFFEQQALNVPSRNLLGIELKYKPLVQTVRRVKKVNAPNARGIRFHARHIDSLFAEGELNNVYIYFPDPWPKKRHQKNRLVRAEFLSLLFKLQKPGTWIDFKTDDSPYFEFVEEELKNSPYKVIRHSRDLHKSEWAQDNFMTGFERIFVRKGQPINYMRLQKSVRE
jgi:tRNA (guanine-N7-)-methyltransferase